MLKAQRSPILLPIILVVLGILILLDNLLLLDSNITNYSPILLIALGGLILWRGDLAPSWQAQSFGITRGSVESGALEISSAEIDVKLSSLKRAGRLIAGQYTARSRPRLAVRNNHARLTMRRGDTWLFSFADWEVEVARDLPWSLLMSSHLGEISADLRGMQLNQAHIASGIGNIKVISPDQEAGPIYVRSTFGDIQLIIPRDIPAVITINGSRMSKVWVRSRDIDTHEDQKVYTTSTYRPEQPALDITIASTFGDIQLAVR